MSGDLSDGYHAVPPGKLATVVTYVEMTARPDPQPRPTPLGYSLERMPRWDLDAFKRLYVEIGFEWLWSSRLLMTDAELDARLHKPGMEAYVPMLGGRWMGVLEMDFAEPATVEVSFFGLVPDAVGGGIGGWLMDRAIDMAWSRPQTRRLWLHTCHFDSPQALPFYRRMGFAPYARAVEVFDDPRLVGRLDPAAGPRIPVITMARRPDGLD